MQVIIFATYYFTTIYKLTDMSNQHDDVDYGRTGESNGSNFKYINLTLHKSGPKADQAEMRFGKDGKHFSEFVGKFLGMTEPKSKPAEGDLPARWEYGIILRSRDSEDGQVKNFLLQLSSHWKSPIVSDIVNHLAWLAENPSHNGLIRIRVYAKKPAGKRAVMRAFVSDGNSDDTSARLPSKYPWVGDRDNGKFEGVPEPTTDAMGQKDFSTIANFWHQEILHIARATQGSQPVTTTQPVPTQVQHTAATTTATMPPPATNGAKTSSRIQDALAWLQKKVNAGKFGDNWQAYEQLCIKLIQMANRTDTASGAMSEADQAAVIGEMATIAGQNFITLPAGMVFGLTGALIQNPAPPPADDNDLPF